MNWVAAGSRRGQRLNDEWKKRRCQPRVTLGIQMNLVRSLKLIRHPISKLGDDLDTTCVEANSDRFQYRVRTTEYHPDKLAHLGQELRELAARKALEINLAMRYIEEDFTGS
jgi:preprotein translocase subunit Sec63